jgi:hypothetical protein
VLRLQRGVRMLLSDSTARHRINRQASISLDRLCSASIPYSFIPTQRHLLVSQQVNRSFAIASIVDQASQILRCRVSKHCGRSQT